MVYSATSRLPEARAGRNCGRVTRRNVTHGPLPSVREASSSARPDPRKAARTVNSVYGYETSTSTMAAPGSPYTDGSFSMPSGSVTSRCSMPRGAKTEMKRNATM